jgi:hypothetical protein
MKRVLAFGLEMVLDETWPGAYYLPQGRHATGAVAPERRRTGPEVLPLNMTVVCVRGREEET